MTCVEIPPKFYSIHITSLPVDIDADTLADKFQWDIFNIVMDPRGSDRSKSTECWLKNANDEREVNDFIHKWNQRPIRNSIITCAKEEDQPELCGKFRLGLCTRGDENCDWMHRTCTAQGNCSASCPYGHARGQKLENTPSTGT